MAYDRKGITIYALLSLIVQSPPTFLCMNKAFHYLAMLLSDSFCHQVVLGFQ